MAYDATNQEMVLFGGLTEAGLRLDDTWTWDGDDWARETPAHSPSARSSARMAFDSSTGQMLLVGGTTDNGLSDETWTWNGSDWTELAPAAPAPAAFNASVAYDPATESVLFFGGKALDGSYPDGTWSWNGTTWTELSPSTSPPGRWGATMGFDPESGEMVLYGGIGDSIGSHDTWTWNGATWTEEFPANLPTPINESAMAYSPAAGSLIMPSGIAEPGAEVQTWSWDGSDWARLSTFASPLARFSGAMGLDEASGKVLLFGGMTMESAALGDTWTFGIQTDQAPTATISSPADGGSYEIGDQVPVNFSCSAAADGPPVASCVGSDGSPAPEGRLDTSSAGSRTYTVTATATDGQTGSTSISYEVTEPKPVCRRVEGGLRIRSFSLTPPLGNARPVPGLRIRISARGDVTAKIAPRITYPTRSGPRSIKLRTRTIRVDRNRKLRFELPKKIRTQLRRSSGSIYGSRIGFRLRASLKSRGDRSSCFREVASRAFSLRVTTVSSRVALRRR